MTKEKTTRKKCETTVKELRFILRNNVTHVYILIEAKGDCKEGTRGWHYKSFSNKPVLSILHNEIDDGSFLEWPNGNPNDGE